MTRETPTASKVKDPNPTARAGSAVCWAPLAVVSPEDSVVTPPAVKSTALWAVSYPTLILHNQRDQLTTPPAVLGVVGGALAGHKLQDGVSDWKDGRDDKKAEEKKAEEDKKAEEKRKAEEKKKDEERKKDEEKKKSEKKEEKKDNRDCQQSSAPGVKYLGNFSGSAKDIRVDCSGEYLLHASCKSKDGSYRASSISLNKILSNDRGSFRWVEGGSQPKAAGPKQFTVRQGDTLRAIGAQVGASWEEIARVNGIQNPDLIHPGQVLNIPGGAADSGCNGGGVGNFGGSARNVKLVDSGRRLEAELKRDGQWVGSSIVLDERIGNDNGCLAFKS